MATPFFQQYDSISTPSGTLIRPGGRVAAYVRSTGLQEGDDLFAMSGNLVTTIAAGVARCRAGMNDIVQVLNGHAETVTTTLFTPVSGAQIIGVATPRSPNAPTITLSATAATLALSAANMTLAGLAIVSSTAAVVAAFNVTAAGVTLANNYISFTGALAANHLITVAGAANCSILDNYISASTAAGNIVNVTGAGSTNLLVRGNVFVQLATGNYVNTAGTAGQSGIVAYNLGKAIGATPTGADGFVIGSATTIGQFENYVSGNNAVIQTLADGT